MKTKKARPLNAVSRKTEILIHIVFISMALTVILPIVLTVMLSFTENSALQENGYSFFPAKWSLRGWECAFERQRILHFFLNSVFVTVLGTLLSLAVSVPYAYALSRKDFKHRRLFNILAVLPWAFSAGLAPTFAWMKQGLHIWDNYAALILPLLVNPLNLIMLRTAFASAVSQSRLDAAYMDGCGEWRAFWHIALPAAKPAVIASAFFTAAAYYGDFFSSLLFIRKDEFIPLGYALMKTHRNPDFFWGCFGPSPIIYPDFDIDRDIPWNLRFVALVIYLLPLLIAAPFMNRLLMKGLEMGPVKYLTDGTAEKGLLTRKKKTKTAAEK